MTNEHNSDNRDGRAMEGDSLEERAVHKRLVALLGDRKVNAVASDLRVNRESVRRYLRGASPSVTFLQRVCIVYGVSADWLLCGRGEPGVILSPDDRADAPSTGAE